MRRVVEGKGKNIYKGIDKFEKRFEARRGGETLQQ